MEDKKKTTGRILNEKGKNDFQVSCINLSYRIRGKAARIRIHKIDRKTEIRGRNSAGATIGAQRKVDVIMHMVRILIYSDIKSRANFLALYSTLKPETSSDSPSAKSNGVRCSSARIEINQVRAKGKNNRTTGIGELIKIFVRSKEPVGVTIEIKMSVSEISYEIVWAMARRAPRRAYLELEAQPAINVMYTLRLEIENSSSAP